MRLRLFNIETLKVLEKITTFAQVQNYKNMISTLIQEEWRPVPNYEGLYDASNFGRIRSLDRWAKNWRGDFFRKGNILRPGKQTSGYLCVGLWKDGMAKTFLVHRLIWETFNGKIPEGMEVNHINEDKTNCSLSNLNLLTHKANNNWGTRKQRASEKMTNGKLSDPVLQLTLDDELIKEWPSMSEAARNGFNISCISECCNGKRKTYKGFKWVKKR